MVSSVRTIGLCNASITSFFVQGFSFSSVEETDVKGVIGRVRSGQVVGFYFENLTHISFSACLVLYNVFPLCT